MGLKEENAKLPARIDSLTLTVQDLLRRLGARDSGETVAVTSSVASAGQCQKRETGRFKKKQGWELTERSSTCVLEPGSFKCGRNSSGESSTPEPLEVK